MGSRRDSERRNFDRIAVEVQVRYRFRALDPSKTLEAEGYEGFTHNLSGGGLLLIGRLPNLDWISPLLMSKIVVDVEVHLPNQEQPVRGHTRVAWIESIEEASQRAAFGLAFTRIAAEERERIIEFVQKNGAKA